MTLGTMTDITSREGILKALKDTLPNALIFPPGAPATLDANDAAVEGLINTLINEAFPETDFYTAAETVLDDNDKLRLLYQRTDRVFQLSLIKPGGRNSLLHFDPTPRALRYQFDWVNVNTPIILDHFDQLMLLYFKIPTTSVKPTLYLVLRPLSSDYQLVFSYDGHTIMPALAAGPGLAPPPPIILPKEMKEKLSVQEVEITTSTGAHATLLKIIDPSSPEAAKKPKDDPKFKEERN
jgi:hypothetical protein